MTEDHFTKELLEDVSSLEKLLGLPSGFFLLLLKEDDWSFIIKTHALVESGMTRLLEVATTPTIPAAFVETLPLTGRHSKLELLQLLDCLDPADAKFVRGLSEIRNLLVHNVTHVHFVLRNYVANLPDQDIQAFMTRACYVFYNESWPKLKPDRETQRAAILAEPKDFVWRTALFFLAMTSLRLDNRKLKKDIERAEREKLKAEVDVARQITAGLAGNFSALGAYQQKLKDRGQESNATGPKSELPDGKAN